MRLVSHSTQKFTLTQHLCSLIKLSLHVYLSGKNFLTIGGAEHPAIRLLDLRTGGVTHTLVGHQHGFVIPVRWSPKQPFLLASGGSDGTVRLWDVRRGKACLASLDQHNTASREQGGWLTTTNTAHDGVVNGLEFTSDGLHLVSIGHDEKMRVWDLESGLNTLVISDLKTNVDDQVSYGPVIRNQHRMEVLPWITPPDMCHLPLVYIPSDDAEILCFVLHTGKLVQRIRGMKRNARGRVTCVAGRAECQVVSIRFLDLQ